MKKYVLIGLLLVTAMSMAQKGGGLGVKGGLNYGSTGDLRENGRTIIDNPDEKVGYHIGFFGKLNLGPIYLRPELQYTILNNEYNGISFDVQKLDVPVLIGFSLIGPLHFFAGPSFQYIIDTDLADVEISDVKEDFTVGAQFGIGINLGNLGIDVRYERGFTNNQVSYVENNIDFNLDTRPQQIIIGLSLKL